MEMRDTVLQQVWDAQDEAYDLMYEYDTLPTATERTRCTRRRDTLST